MNPTYLTVLALWLSTSVGAVDAILRLRKSTPYIGRHRPEGRRDVHWLGWREALEARIAHIRATAKDLAEPVTIGERGRIAAFRREAVAALREPTAEMPVPDLDSDVTHYDKSAGKANYLRLRTSLLDAEVAALTDWPVVDLEALRVRSAVPTVADDDWYAAVVS